MQAFCGAGGVDGFLQWDFSESHLEGLKPCRRLLGRSRKGPPPGRTDAALLEALLCVSRGVCR